jgi:hypothetical protein
VKPNADTTCGACGKPLDLWTGNRTLDGVAVCREGCNGAVMAKAREEAEELAQADEPPQLPEAAYHDQADDDQAEELAPYKPIRQLWRCPPCAWVREFASAYGDPPRPACPKCGRPMLRAHWSHDDDPDDNRCEIIMDEAPDALQAEADPLAVPCRRCRAQAGQKCRDYKGQNKQPCPERGRPDDEPEPTPRPEPTLYDFE